MGLIIGVDTDGVLTDLSNFHKENGKTVLKKEIVNPNAYDAKEMYGLTEKENIMYGLKVLGKYFKDVEPRKYCVETLKQIYSEGDELHEITARKFVTFRNLVGFYYRTLFYKWFKKIGVKNLFKSYQFCSEEFAPRDKLIACKKLSVDVMIEDKPDVALFLANNGVKVLLFDAPYNKEVNNENIKRVVDWKEVYEQIKLIKQNQAIDEVSKFQNLDYELVSKLSEIEKTNYIKTKRRYLRSLKINEKEFKKGDRIYKLFYTALYLPIKLKYHPKIFGKENIPYQNGYIIASNHVNSSDQYLISLALGNRPYTGFAASTIRNTFRGRIFKLTKGAVFIDRNDKLSTKEGSNELSVRIAHDKIGLIFPEGTRKNKDEEGRKKFQLPFKIGTVKIAQETGVPILPVSIYYGEKINEVRFGNIMFIEPEKELIVINRELEKTIALLTYKNIEYETKLIKIKTKKNN